MFDVAAEVPLEGADASTTWPRWLPGAALVALVVIAYLPALRAGWVWDDDYYVTNNPTLGSADGLRRIWFEVGAVPQYYPLVHTTFWIEHRLWGLGPIGYHLDNALLHGIASLLLWRVLRRLELPGAWAAAAIFAVHPVHVESVAWVTERKNMLSGVMYFGAALAYLHFLSEKRWGFYFAALLLFVLSLLSKTVTCSLPAAILVVIWWKRGRLTMRDVAPLVPFFIIGGGFAMLTGWMERHVVGAWGPEWQFTFGERCIIAGRALWFYLGHLIFPWPLVFVYPRWDVRGAGWSAYGFPLAAGVVLVGLIVLRHRIGRGPAAAAMLFAGTLVPALGFVNTLPMRYSFVADHFVYLASAPVFAALVAARARHIPGARAARFRVGLVITVLAALTWQRCHAFRDAETLWRDTLAKNPSAWMAQHNLGNILLGRGELDEAEKRFREAIRLKPDHVEARVSMGQVAEKRDQFVEAEKWYRDALAIEPVNRLALYNLARLARIYNTIGARLATEGKLAEAEAAFRRATGADPDYADAHLNLGIVLEKQGNRREAQREYNEAVRLDPQSARARQRLETLLRQ